VPEVVEVGTIVGTTATTVEDIIVDVEDMEATEVTTITVVATTMVVVAAAVVEEDVEIGAVETVAEVVDFELLTIIIE
jgi:hypothetical protein